jgi:hypothetical protein
MQPRVRTRTALLAVSLAGFGLAGCVGDRVKDADELAPDPAAAGSIAASADSASTDSMTARADTTPAPAGSEGATAATATSIDTTAALIAADTIAVDPGARVRPTGERVIHVAEPDSLHGLYLNAWAAGSTRKLAKLIDIANRTDINAFVIDVKEGGEISYRSGVVLANRIGAARSYIRDPRAMLQQLRDAGIYPIARIVLFKDAKLAAGKPSWAIRREDGSLWTDAAGETWVDSFNRSVWDYNIAIAKEAIELGFAEVQWDYVRFPDVPRALMATAVWPERNGRTKADGIREFLQYSREQLAEYDVPVTADVFGLTVSVQNDLGIGQQWEKMADATDVLLPMVYPSHFARGSYGIARPNAAPYETVKHAMDIAVKRTRSIENAAEIRPWLQDFTLGSPKYTASHVRAQIQATYDAGLTDWVLWNPGSNYTVEALASPDGVPPYLPSLVPAYTSIAGRAR